MSSEDSAYENEESEYLEEDEQDDAPKKKVAAKQKKIVKKTSNVKAEKAKPAAKKPQPKPTPAKETTDKTPKTKDIINFLTEGIKLKPLTEITAQAYTDLQNCTNAPAFSLCYETHLAKVLNMYDGDTLTVVIYLNGTLKKFKVRVGGVDTPEMKDPSPEIAQYSKRVRDILIEKIKGRIVKIEFGNFDKYGRLLGNIFVRATNGDLINLTDFMITNGMAKPYGGKTKNVFTVADYKKVKSSLQNLHFPDTVDYPNVSENNSDPHFVVLV